MNVTAPIDFLLSFFALATKQNIRSFCRLETSDDDMAFAAKDGSLVSVIRVDGCRNVVGAEELNAIVSGAQISFAPFLQNLGHALQIWFYRDPDRARDEVEKTLARSRQAAEAAHLDLDDLFEERVRHLPNFLSWEGMYFTLWSRPGLLSKEEVKEAGKRSKKLAEGSPFMRYAQWPLSGIEELRTRHSSFVNTVISDLNALGMRAELLDVHKALVAVRGALNPRCLKDSGWRPILPGDKPSARLPDNIEQPGDDHKDVSNLLWPPLDSQLFLEDAEAIDNNLVQIGDYVFGSADLSLGPEELQPFAALLGRLIEGRNPPPWRVSFLIEGAGLQAQAMKGQLVSVLSWASSSNKMIHHALKQLKAAALEGETIVRLRVSFATWGPKADQAKVKERVAMLQRAVEGWGNCQTLALPGDPLEGVMSSAMGIHCASTAPPAAAPLYDALYMLPWNRAASPWKQGAIVFRTPDGKPWPYQPGSSLQTTWIDLVFAPPGFGKSVLINSINLACTVSPQLGRGETNLPRIAIIDIGPSSSGLISLLKESLPPKQRHQAVYKRLQMTRKYAINPFDTQIGTRYPLPQERAFLVNVLTLLCTPVGDDKPYEGLNALAGLVVDEVYKMYSDEVSPKPYSYGEDPAVDDALKKHHLDIPNDATWWEVVDVFGEQGLYHEASLAQRHAVPLLSDTINAVRTRQVEDLFGGVRTPTNEPLTEAFQRLISSAVREYPLLAYPTQFDVGSARVCALDLDEVAPRGGKTADRQTAVMYMLARHVLARDFFLNVESLPLLPKSYQDYHMKRIQELRESPKRLVYDEFHRTSGSDAVRAQVKIDIREGRKWGVQICLASQLLEDFDDQMIDQATGIWIVGSGSDKAVNQLTKTFGLNDTAQFIVRRRLRGPGRGGAPFLAVLRLKDGRYEQLLVNTLGPIELWSLSTTAEDAEIRKRLYSRIGPRKARLILAKSFPGGTAKPELERRLSNAQDSGMFGDEVEDSIVDEIVRELADKAADIPDGRA